MEDEKLSSKIETFVKLEVRCSSIFLSGCEDRELVISLGCNIHTSERVIETYDEFELYSFTDKKIILSFIRLFEERKYLKLNT
jgi:hypothetical protein